MGRSYVLNYVHCVFGTKSRTRWIKDSPPLWGYIRGIARNCHFDLLAIGGTEDHVHLLLSVPAGKHVSELMRDTKANSSRHMRRSLPGFAWQDGYAAISVSPSQLGIVKKYIANQPEHHRKHRFEDEYITLLQKAGIQFDPSQVFD
jgi:putative transposase